jgi:hypothetical protein
MRYRGENLVENSVNEGCRGWDLEDIAGDSLRPVSVHSYYNWKLITVQDKLSFTVIKLLSHPIKFLLYFFSRISKIIDVA